MTILTNEVALTLNRIAILNDFFVYKISADSITGDNFRKTLTAIYRDIQPLAVINYNKVKIYALCKSKLPERARYDTFKVKPLHDLSDLSDRILARLLIHALPQLKYNGSAYGLGLYYLNDSKFYDDKKGMRFTYYYTFKLDIAPVTHDNSKSVVTIHGRTLTPRAYHANDDGTYPAKIAKLASISIDPFLYEIKKDKIKKDKPSKGKFDTNDYIERAIRNKRMTSDMLSLDAKKPKNFFFSKTGRLAGFHQDVITYLGDYLQLEWQSMPAEYRTFFNEKLIKVQYEKIAKLLQSYDFYLVLKEPFSPAMTKQLTQYLQEEWDITLKTAEELQPFSPTHQAINLLIHHNKDHYKENNLPDPYQQLQTSLKNQFILKQSLTLETLITDKKTLNLPAIDNAMTEILVKIEVMLGKLVLIQPEQDWRCITAHYIKNPDPDLMDSFDGYHVVDYYANDNTLSYQRIEADNALAYDITMQLITTIASPNYTLKTTDHFIIQNPLTNPIYYLIQESNYRPLPDFVGLDKQTKAIHTAHDHGFHRDWAKQYLTLIENNEIQLDMDKQPDKDFVKKLTDIANAPNEIISKDNFFKFKLLYKGKGKDFIDWVYQTHGYLWNTSLRGQETGYVEVLKGFYYEPNRQYYFAGLADGLDSNISNFSVMRKIYTNHPDVEHSALLNLMDKNFYIRHKQSTVLPFLFKHLREFSVLNEL